MTASLATTIRQAGLVAAFALAFSTLSSSASFAFSPEAQQMCTGDAFRLCSSEIPDIPRITACMMQAARQSERRLPHRDGPRSGAAGQGRGEIARGLPHCRNVAQNALPRRFERIRTR